MQTHIAVEQVGFCLASILAVISPSFSWAFSFLDCPQPLSLTVWVTSAYDGGGFTGEMMRDSGCGKGGYCN